MSSLKSACVALFLATGLTPLCTERLLAADGWFPFDMSVEDLWVEDEKGFRTEGAVTVPNGTPLTIHCAWAIRPTQYVEVKEKLWWNGNIVNADGHTQGIFPIEIPPDKYGDIQWETGSVLTLNKASHSIHGTKKLEGKFKTGWKATGAGKHTLSCDLDSFDYNIDLEKVRANNHRQITVTVLDSPGDVSVTAATRETASVTKYTPRLSKNETVSDLGQPAMESKDTGLYTGTTRTATPANGALIPRPYLERPATDRSTTVAKRGSKPAFDARKEYTAVRTAQGTAAMSNDLNDAAPASLVFEVESLMPTAVTSGGQILRQDMTGFGSGWGGNAQLFWRPPAPAGDKPYLITEFELKATGTYDLVLHYTTAPDFGQFTVYIDGTHATKHDGYGSQVGLRQALLGRYPLSAGRHELAFEVSGKNPQSTGYIVGVDRLRLERAP